MNAVFTVRNFGLLFVLIAPCFGGFYLAGRASRELRELDGVIRLLRHIKNEISVKLARQPDIFANFTCPALESNGFLRVLRESEIDECSALENALNTDGKRLAISEAALTSLMDFARVLGKTSAGEQVEACEVCLKAETELYSEISGEIKNKKKLYRTAGASFGFISFILLV